MNKLVIAYFGMGRAITQYHLPFTYERDDIEIKYVYRRPEDRLLDREVEDLYPKLTIEENIEKVLNDPDVQLIVIDSPNATHTSYAKMVLQAGKHVLVEKPFAMNAKDAKEVLELAKEKNLIAMSNQNRRHDGDFRTLKAVLESGVLGDVYDIESNYDYFLPNNKKTDTPIYLLGLGVHTIDQIISLFGSPKKTNYDVTSLYNPGHSDDYFDLDFFYPKTKVSVKTSYIVKIAPPRFKANGTKGSLLIPQAGHKSTGDTKTDLYGFLSYIDDAGQEIEENIAILENDYGAIYDNLKESILFGKEKSIKDQEIIEVLDIIEKGIEISQKSR